MRILHIPHAYHPVTGGAELICLKVSELLAAQGHTVRVLTADVGAVQGYYEFGIARAPAPAMEVSNDVEIVRLPYLGRLLDVVGHRLFGSTPTAVRHRARGRIMQFARHRLTRRITRETRNFQPDVVMAMPHLVVNVLSVLSAQDALGFPLVMEPMLHEEDPDWPTEQMRRALRQAGAVIALTTHEANRLESAYAVEPDRIFHCSVGVEIPAVGGQLHRFVPGAQGPVEGLA